MFELVDNIRSMLQACQTVKPGEKVLVIADNEGHSAWMGQLFMDAANSLGAEAVLMTINPPEMRSQEPPSPAAAAMKGANVVLRISDKAPFAHTTARKEFVASGGRYSPFENFSVEDIIMGVKASDIEILKKRSDAIAELLTKAHKVRVTTPAGTDVSLSLEGRDGASMHPMTSMGGALYYYSEAATAPLEGTAEGIWVVDIAFIDWYYLLRQPIKMKVKQGRVVEILSTGEDSDKLRKVLEKYKNADNIGELGIGTSHIVPLPVRGTRRDAARLGTAHFALGRSDNVGGTVWSEVHWDGVMDRVTIELDGKAILDNGKLCI